MTPPPTLDQLITTVRADAASDEPLDQLAAAATTINTLTETGDAVLGHFVDRCRGAGHTWTEISAVLGVTKQAVHKRFTSTDGLAGATLERFTGRARTVLERSRAEASRFGHPYVGTEHLLLALFAEPESVAAQVLAERDITAAGVESALLKITPADPGSAPTDSPQTPRLRRLLEAAVAEALDLGHNYVGTEHLLLALYRQPDSLGTKLLQQLGAEPDAIRAAVIKALSGYRS